MRPTDPVSYPTVPNPAAPVVMSSVDWMVPFPTDLDRAGAARAGGRPCRRRDVGGTDVERLPFVLLTASVPPTFRLLPPPTSLNGDPKSPLPMMLSPPAVVGDRCSAGRVKSPGDRVEAGQRAVGCQRAGVGDPRAPVSSAR